MTKRGTTHIMVGKGIPDDGGILSEETFESVTEAYQFIKAKGLDGARPVKVWPPARIKEVTRVTMTIGEE